MPTEYPGRYTAAMDGSFVVFLIGFRINRLLAVGKWLPVARAMGPMLRELYADPSRGFLGAHTSLYWRGAMVTQYWRSFEQLVTYAQARDAGHLPAWKAFNRSVGSDGTVGIWHETYQVSSGHFEAIYANMPRFGLAAAGTHQPVTRSLDDARSRIQTGPPGAVS